MEKVYVYKNSYGEYRVHPAVVVVTGGQKLRVFNATGVAVTVTVPAGASKPSDPLSVVIAAEGRDDIPCRSQGSDKTRAYSYKVATRLGKRAHGNSDPILIIEN